MSIKPKSTNTPTPEKASEKQAKSKLMQILEKYDAVSFESKSLKYWLYEKGKQVNTKTETRTKKYPFVVSVIINPSENGKKNDGLFYKENAMKLLIEDKDYSQDFYPEEFSYYHIDGNTIRALLEREDGVDGYWVYSLSLLENRIVIEKYYLDTSIFPSNSQQDEYETSINDFINKNKKGKFQLKASDTYTE